MELLEGGDLTITGRLVQASNATFLCELRRDDLDSPLNCVYKPVRGERPLWDFPDGTLAQREVAAYQLSTEAGFNLVPTTILFDGPLGLGSLQAWVEVDEDAEDLVDLARGRVPPGWFHVVDGLDRHERPVRVIHRDDSRLRRMALFDAVLNNSDRKGAHILQDCGQAVWGVDHGVSLHAEDKLRTVLWGWAGAPLSGEERSLVRAAREAGGTLGSLITPAEIEALELRCEILLEEGAFPEPYGHWPSIPWPPL